MQSLTYEQFRNIVTKQVNVVVKVFQLMDFSDLTSPMAIKEIMDSNASQLQGVILMLNIMKKEDILSQNERDELGKLVLEGMTILFQEAQKFGLCKTIGILLHETLQKLLYEEHPDGKRWF
jgi:predicted methyltransferase